MIEVFDLEEEFVLYNGGLYFVDEVDEERICLIRYRKDGLPDYESGWLDVPWKERKKMKVVKE